MLCTALQIIVSASISTQLQVEDNPLSLEAESRRWTNIGTKFALNSEFQCNF